MVVDRGERHPDVVRPRLLVQGLGGDMPVGAGEQEPCQRQALARRPQPRGAQAFKRGSIGSFLPYCEYGRMQTKNKGLTKEA